MAQTLAPKFLTLLLFFFMNGQGITARDLKTELRDVDSNEQPYITQYGHTKPDYAASYNTHDSNGPYKTSYGNHEAEKPDYNTGYRTHTHHSNELYKTAYGNHEAEKPDYNTGYKARTHDSNEPYKTSYGNREAEKPDYNTGYRAHTHDSNEPYRTSYGNHEAEKPNYNTGYRAHTHDSNEPYKTSYGNHEAEKPDYDTGYRAHTHDSNKPYKTSYGNHEAEKPDYDTGYRAHTHDSNEPYKTSYGNREAEKPDYNTGYRAHTHDSNEPYRTSYGNHEAEKPDYDTGYRAHTHDSNKPYKTSYGNHEAEKPDYDTGYRAHTHDSNEPYKTSYGNHEAEKPDYDTGYRTHTHNSNKPYLTYAKHETDESNGPYIASYGKHEPNHPYITQYGPTSLDLKDLTSPNSKDLEGSASSNLDRTEAFKTGFFNLDDLYVGHEMTLQFPVQEVSHYLPKKAADSIPLSKSQLPSVLQLFSISEDSTQAKAMRGTLEECEGETITGETKICANSLESMLEFVDTIIGTDTKHSILSTSNLSPTATPLQKYTILEVSHDIHAPKWVACHPLPYPYAIHYCHYIATGSKVFKVTLVGDENGDKMEALGICHLDTSDWNPDHIVFKQLGIKAGMNTPVCHFFPVNHLLWVPEEPSKATM
ncbi:BURP domain-containing protein 12-like [Vicia villosa]|uniref:BURP domain-containing protein 12-like n=1 Tax=Vicia villosa TaxID=3911 RepID=UPI00273C3D3D|nr:BURP domain-containing protein 12-like [Vicia villosa]